jgi:hypothetical protein
MASTLNLTRHKKRQRWYWNFKFEIFVVVAGLVAMNAIFIASAFRGDTVDREAAAHLGDFVGGYVGTFFVLMSVVFLIATLRNQQSSTAHDNFENRYFELLKLHRDNVAELQLQEISGRKIFVWLIRELRSIMLVVREVAREQKISLDDRGVLQVSYYVLFFGTGPNSSRMLGASLASSPGLFVDALEKRLNDPTMKQSVQTSRQFPYTPFEGHQSRLGHYYRHLYQTVRYVDAQSDIEQKYDYVKTVRAQLSTHEQALLLVNSLTPIGQNWWSNGFIVNYRMVQNLPREFFDSSYELDTKSLFPSGYFEWEETEKRN